LAHGFRGFGPWSHWVLLLWACVCSVCDRAVSQLMARKHERERERFISELIHF
jgi:hypothetical protein